MRTVAAARAGRSRWQAWWLQQWFAPRPGAVATLLMPLAGLYGLLQARDRRQRERQALQRPQPPCTVVVVGNLVVGGAGKTPTTIAIVQALHRAGWRPGVVSRGHGRSSTADCAVTTASSVADVGDEPMLIHRRTGAPAQVGLDRVQAALMLLHRDPAVDVIVADDGLQHRQLRRDIEVIVFDERGIGNGLLLPAGPLREPFAAQPPAGALVLYNHGQASTAWLGAASRRDLTGAWRLDDWLAGRLGSPQPLAGLRGRPLLALAGIAVPERFFAALEAQGLTLRRAPRADHAHYDALPWPAGTADVITTEKDAVKLAPWAGDPARVWVVGLDLKLPVAFETALLARLPAHTPP